MKQGRLRWLRLTSAPKIMAPPLMPLLVPLLALLCLALAVPDAEARGFRLAGVFLGGVVVGSAVFAHRYVYPAPVYFAPYYGPSHIVYPPTVTYVSPSYIAPPIVVQQAAPVVAPAASQYTVPQPASIEDRLRRLRSICEQECHQRREQILHEI